MKPLVVIRPQPGCDATMAAAQAHGLEAYGFPMFEVCPLAWQAPAADSFDALLIGSANALRHGGIALNAYRGKPTYAVGQTSAEAAIAAGLKVVASGEGGLQELLALLEPDHLRLLRLSGRERVSLTLPLAVSLTERLVYASVPEPMPEELISLLRRPATVLLHSAEAAHHFASQCEVHAIARSGLVLLALGPRIARSAGEGWAKLAAADAPNDHALLALAKQMCQENSQFPETMKRA
jgi:uroporphyrinogen-III synthase